MKAVACRFGTLEPFCHNDLVLTSIKSETTRKVALNTLFQLIGKLVSMSITVLATIIVTKMYGRVGYGQFNLMQNFPALFFIVVDFGLNAIATRELSKDWSRAEKYLGNILVIRVLLSVILMALCILALVFFPYSAQLRFGIYLSLFLILTQALYATTNIIFQVKLRYDLSTVGYILGSLAVLILVLVLSYFRVNIIWVSFSYVVGGIVTFVANIIFIRRLHIHISLGLDKEIWKLLFIQSLPLGLMFIFSQINFKADSILLSVLKLPSKYNLTNIESVGVYGLPYKVFEVALVVPTFFMNTVYPILVRHMMESKEKLRATILNSIYALFGFGLVMAVFGVVFAPLIINFLGGGQFGQSILALRLLLAGLFVFYLTQPISWLIVTLGKQKYLPFIYLASAVFNVTANIIFIPRYSFYASSVITWISELLILFMLIFFALKAWKIKYA